MKAISIKQPWASRIAQKRKTIETRTWKTNHRGWLLIVASKKPKYPFSGFALAIACLVDCRSMKIADEWAAMSGYQKGLYSWILKEIRPIKPFPVRGKLGLYEVDDELIEEET